MTPPELFLETTYAQAAASNRRLKICFVTNEFVTELSAAGGLANYLNRMTRVLHDMGHEVEVLVLARDEPTIKDFNGIRVESVRGEWNWLMHVFYKLRKLNWRFQLLYTNDALAHATGLAKAFARRDAEKQFDIVQSGNGSLSGLYLPRRKGLTHLLRMSSVRSLIFEADDTLSNETQFDYAMYNRFERKLIRKADIPYAPSQFTCDYFKNTHNLSLQVIRPPVAIEAEPSESPPEGLPDRFYLYFGKFRPVKGTDVLAKALPLVWQQEPDFTMVWVGSDGYHRLGEFARYEKLWGPFRNRIVTIEPLEKPDLYAVLKRAEVSVLPSRVDNLPNTVIESLLFETPVIGTNGASIDELVEEGKSGSLFPLGDEKALAELLIQGWRKQLPWQKHGFSIPAILAEMQPERAANKFIQLVLQFQMRYV